MWRDDNDFFMFGERFGQIENKWCIHISLEARKTLRADDDIHNGTCLWQSLEASVDKHPHLFDTAQLTEVDGFKRVV